MMKKYVACTLLLFMVVGCSAPKDSDVNEDHERVEITDDYEIPEVEVDF